ncbi:hypothetical protein [Erwinia oleae]|nr:hypothetical protein [Erwinia oleae]
MKATVVSHTHTVDIVDKTSRALAQGEARLNFGHEGVGMVKEVGSGVTF